MAYFLDLNGDTSQLSGDPQLGSLPLLTTFLKSYARPFLGISPSPVNVKQQNGTSEETAGADMAEQTGADEVIPESEELVEPEVRERFKKMCEGYYDNVAKKLVREHDVRLIMWFWDCCPGLIRSAATSRPRQEKSRSIYPVWRDFRRSPAGV